MLSSLPPRTVEEEVWSRPAAHLLFFLPTSGSNDNQAGVSQVHVNVGLPISWEVMKPLEKEAIQRKSCMHLSDFPLVKTARLRRICGRGGQTINKTTMNLRELVMPSL